MSTEGRIRPFRSADFDIIRPWFAGSIDLHFMPRSAVIFECVEPWRDGRPLGVVWILHDGGVAYSYSPKTCPKLSPGTAAEVLAALLNFAADRARAAAFGCFIAPSPSGPLEDLLGVAAITTETPSDQ